MTTNNQDKLISIGLPAYNGERFIRQTLDSLLSQDYKNLELIIADNNSTDRTADICGEYLAKDKRIRYYRNERNLGAHQNFNRTFELSSGEYFMWAAANDLWDKNFISRCLDVLDNNPEAVLCYSQAVLIDENGNKLRILSDSFDTRFIKNPAQRFSYTIWNLGPGIPLHGLIRSSALRQTRLLVPIIRASDYLCLAELSLRGTILQIPLPLFYRRETSPEERAKQKEFVSLMTNQKIRRTFRRNYQIMFHFLKSVKKAPLGKKDKLKLAIDTFYCVIKRFCVIEDMLEAVNLLNFFRRANKLANTFFKH